MNEINEPLNHMRRLVTANTKTISILGARAMVLGKFFDAVLPQLKNSQHEDIARSFREGIEDTMSRMDDVPLPAEYHSALLQLTNSILAALDQKSAACR
ncbi:MULTISPECIES: hypothetical protein [Paraburkholderia]|uniref:Uncharacterized protein n=1 Tax=Paraburkholderia aspalathi TaxID=1324617 RepID=A0A1I7ES38_9BURK|nr:hypothetical protein [Paraburkholderia aspalathi]SFU26720.1 hypothetical protein SAMN05192563_10669 [Paraburkholderia aspalathi]